MSAFILDGELSVSFEQADGVEFVGDVGGLVTGSFATSVTRVGCQSCGDYTYYGSFPIIRSQ